MFVIHTNIHAITINDKKSSQDWRRAEMGIWEVLGKRKERKGRHVAITL